MASTMACGWMTTSPPTQLMLWQPSRRRVHAMAASVRASISSPLSLSVGDVAVLAEGAAHVAGGEEDRARALGAAIEELLAGVMEMRADPRAGGKLARPELAAPHAVDAAVPRAEIAVGEHAPGERAAEVEQARPLCVRRQ